VLQQNENSTSLLPLRKREQVVRYFSYDGVCRYRPHDRYCRRTSLYDKKKHSVYRRLEYSKRLHWKHVLQLRAVQLDVTSPSCAILGENITRSSRDNWIPCKTRGYFMIYVDNKLQIMLRNNSWYGLWDKFSVSLKIYSKNQNFFFCISRINIYTTLLSLVQISFILI